MPGILITEGEADAVLLKSLVGDSVSEDVKYIAAGGWSSADALARSYLTDPTTKVAIVVDADSSDPNVIEERKRFLKRSLGQIATRDRFRIVVVAPEIESLLFDDRSAIEALIQGHISDTEFVRGQYEPRAVLATLTKHPRAVIYERLSGANLEKIRSRPEIQDLRRFLHMKRNMVAV